MDAKHRDEQDRVGRGRPRRFDPGRGEHIIEVALQVIVDKGVGGLTQRLVAGAADVPLGSVTYHYPTKRELVRAAFALFVEEQTALYERIVGAANTQAELLEVLEGMVTGGPNRERAGVLGFELHLAALRDPWLRDLTQRWTDASRTTLARLMDPESAADLDAFLEGLILHSLLAPERSGRPPTRRSIARFLETVDGPVAGPREASDA
ncbi:TetR/AcrR family transcriptional regulator [Leifsonia sp. AG29]|uniref:TetR/AcrR family transcriptional regulator n=1 Tax=Leifsonia sp. AG29 TaxID=2598860 RepID=UPI00131ACCAF|nr:TetR family transcriptional regulator [Leifsonia sp. AG29]